MIVCVCNGVSEKKIIEVSSQKKCSIIKAAQLLNLGDSCGSCLTTLGSLDTKKCGKEKDHKAKKD